MEARLISATNQDLQQLVEERRFRQDFFFRINVVPLYVPPLRERREDIPLLVEHFVHRLREQTGRDVTAIASDALERLIGHDWPGNVRELRSVLEYAFVVCPGGELRIDHLPGHRDVGRTGTATLEAVDRQRPTGAAVLSAREREERRDLVEALRASGGNKSAAARILGVTRVTVTNRMHKYGVRPDVAIG